MSQQPFWDSKAAPPLPEAPAPLPGYTSSLTRKTCASTRFLFSPSSQPLNQATDHLITCPHPRQCIGCLLMPSLSHPPQDSEGQRFLVATTGTWKQGQGPGSKKQACDCFGF